MHGQALPPGLPESARLDEPAFTVSTKATSGHDENITIAEAAEVVGSEVLSEAGELCLAVYARGAALAETRGIIVADTKFELGWIDGRLALCDEVLTPDSSRFWDAAIYEPGSAPPSFDKQPLRDWLEESGWNKTPPPPELPAEVVTATAKRYVDAYERITGRSLSDWPGGSPASPGRDA